MDFLAKTTKSEFSGVGLIQNRRENWKKRKSIYGSSRWWDAAFYDQEQSLETFTNGPVNWCCIYCMCVCWSEKGHFVLEAPNNLLDENRKKPPLVFSRTPLSHILSGTTVVLGTRTVPVVAGAFFLFLAMMIDDDEASPPPPYRPCRASFYCC